MLTAFQEVLQNKKLTPLFQPIVELRHGAIVGYEALIRGPENTPLYSPLALFELADQHGQRFELEYLCCELHLEQFRTLGLTGKLFLNTSPSLHQTEGDERSLSSFFSTLRDREFDQVVVELTEDCSVSSMQMLHDVVKMYRETGVQLAIDDLGQGFSTLKLWTELRPEYVKIDRFFVRGIHEDPLRQQLVRSICEIAFQAQSTVIAEGIETQEELVMLRRLGVMCGQGFFLGRPEKQPKTSLETTLLALFRTPFGTPTLTALGRADKPVTAHRLVRQVPVVAFEVPTNVVCDRFQKDASLNTLVVLRGGMPVGLLRRDRLFDRLARLYHRELYGSRACGEMIENTPLIIDRKMPLQELAQWVTDGPEHYMSDGFIITRDGSYLGVGSSADLMREVSQLQLQAARYANPLTQLPGNVPINEHLEQLLRGQSPFAVCYGDLDYFKPFNDLYGYRKGDEVIQITASLFVEASHPEHDFVGHVGGDDFIVIFKSSDWERRCQSIIQNLPLALSHLYSAEHLRMGGYYAENRQQVEEFHSLVALSLGVVEVNPVHLYNSSLVAEMAASAKTMAKKTLGSSLFIERRKPLSPVKHGDKGQGRNGNWLM
ncbi:GGDEF domain-containing protein [Paenalcaligenes sp. Me131]|uniref:GGDEF domain-containing protein n=1 Tax=Paenalcaligenes sp. Me131 TaxID=3392636 RepID=UPI003D27C5B5